MPIQFDQVGVFNGGASDWGWVELGIFLHMWIPPVFPGPQRVNGKKRLMCVCFFSGLLVAFGSHEGTPRYGTDVGSSAWC